MTLSTFIQHDTHTRKIPLAGTKHPNQLVLTIINGMSDTHTHMETRSHNDIRVSIYHRLVRYIYSYP